MERQIDYCPTQLSINNYESGGETKTIAADTILYAVGMTSNDYDYLSLCGKAPFVTLIGDSKKVGKVSDAVHQGYFAALDL